MGVFLVLWWFLRVSLGYLDVSWDSLMGAFVCYGGALELVWGALGVSFGCYGGVLECH